MGSEFNSPFPMAGYPGGLFGGCSHPSPHHWPVPLQLCSSSDELQYIILWYIVIPTLWWSVNLSHNWALNVWTVTVIKTPRTINIQINCKSYCLYWTACVLWMAEAFTSAHTSGETANQGHFTPSYLILCVSQKAIIY